MQTLRPTPAQHHRKSAVFVFKELRGCRGVFAGNDSNSKSALPPQYLGLYEVLKRGDKEFIIDRDGKEDTVSTDLLKPAFEVSEDTPNKFTTPPIRKVTFSHRFFC